MRKLAMLLTAVMFLTANITPALACYGVRAMGMGGAFIGVADDVQSVYWNPAGLAFLKRPQLSTQYITNNRDSINYINVFEFAAPAGKDAGWGLSYVTDRDMPDTKYHEDWVVGSYGQKIGADTAVGINLRTVSARSGNPGESGRHNATGIDVSFLTKRGKVSYGMLVQDANIPTVLGGGHMERNWRPGFAYRPDDKTIIAFDVYNAISAGGDKAEYSMGVEHAVGKRVKVRVGNYHGSMTYGVGVEVGKDVQVNYAFLSGKLAHTSLVGVQMSF